jgi:hypothetical protein
MIYRTGATATPDGTFTPIDTIQIAEGEYILQYKVPVIAFRYLTQSALQAFINGVVAVKNAAAGPGEQLTKIEGIEMDDTTGDIFVRVNVSYRPMQKLPDGTPVTVAEAGVNYVKVIAVVGAFFAAIGITLTLVQVFTKKVGQAAAPLAAGGIGILVGVAIGAILVLYFVARRFE